MSNLLPRDVRQRRLLRVKGRRWKKSPLLNECQSSREFWLWQQKETIPERNESLKKVVELKTNLSKTETPKPQKSMMSNKQKKSVKGTGLAKGSNAKPPGPRPDRLKIHKPGPEGTKTPPTLTAKCLKLKLKRRLEKKIKHPSLHPDYVKWVKENPLSERRPRAGKAEEEYYRHFKEMDNLRSDDASGTPSKAFVGLMDLLYPNKELPYAPIWTTTMV
jgi:hypothetical protein